MTTTQQMRAIVIDRFGGPEELTLRNVAIPPLGAGQILIKVAIAGVGVWDAAERAGRMAAIAPESVRRLPRVLGGDGAGTIAALGAGVSGFGVGDKVFGYGFLNPKGGFYAEYAAIPASQVARIPSTLDMAQAGALAVTGITALRGLADALKLAASQRLLVFGASGGVGYPAVQLAKAMGAKVIAVVAGADGAALVQEAGADAVVDSKADDLAGAIRGFAPDGLDAVLAVVNAAGLDTAIAAIRPGGRIAFPHGVQPEPKGGPGVDAIGYDGIPDRATFDRLNALIERHPSRVHLAESFPLADAAAAHRAFAQRHLGRMVLRVA